MSTAPTLTATWSLATPGSARGAIAIFDIATNTPADIEAFFKAFAIAPVAVGRVGLRSLMGIDTGLVTRPSPTAVQLMPHAGAAVVRALAAALDRAGVVRATAANYPEAATPLEQHMLHALARAQSPRAIDLLLDQPRRWALPNAASDPAIDRMLNHLIHPPLLAAVGASNIGKSTLVNELAGRGVSIVADEAGTTRDYVGVLLELDGLAVRYIDTPGLRDHAPAEEQAARAGALDLAARADLLLLCGDPTHPPPEPAALGCEAVPHTLRVCLRADLARAANGWWASADARVAIAAEAQGVRELAAMVRQTLVPHAVLESPAPWRFWDPAGGGRAIPGCRS